MATTYTGGPSEAVRAGIDWLAQQRQRFDAAPADDSAQIALVTADFEDEASLLLHLYGILKNGLERLVDQVPPPPQGHSLEVLRKYEASFRKWHEIASDWLALGRRLATFGSVRQLAELQDAVGFCPFIGASVDDLLAKQQEEGTVSLGEVRDALRRRLHAQGR